MCLTSEQRSSNFLRAMEMEESKDVDMGCE